MGRLAKTEQNEEQEEIKQAVQENNQPSEKISYIPIEMAILDELQNIKSELQELKLAFKKGFTIKEIINAISEKEI